MVAQNKKYEEFKNVFKQQKERKVLFAFFINLRFINFLYFISKCNSLRFVVKKGALTSQIFYGKRITADIKILMRKIIIFQ